MKQLLLPAALALGLLAQCHRAEPDPARPEDQLPPATQTGAGTFGCLLNGQPWTPRGNDGISNFYIVYDPTYHGGNLSVRTYRYPDNSVNFQAINFGGDSISKAGTYTFSSRNLAGSWPIGVVYTDNSQPAACSDYAYRRGATGAMQLIITRLDYRGGVISGTFAFTLAQPGCDTIKVTQGRFDKKL